MTIENAFTIKGYFIAEPPPKIIQDALDAVIEALRAPQVQTRIDTPKSTILKSLSKHVAGVTPPARTDEPEESGPAAKPLYVPRPKEKPEAPLPHKVVEPEPEAKAGWTAHQKELALRMNAEGKSPSEIAAAIKKPYGPVYQWLYAQRKKSADEPAQKPTAQSSRRTWTESEKDELRRLMKTNTPMDSMMLALNRPRADILSMRAVLNNELFTEKDLTTYEDDQGRTVIKCPPAYAHGVSPQRNVGARV